ncbi:FAD:protein FMN transferase [Paenibacillus dakarensis]|uniref:FAD:protein FMN transferase n=1 Tax=Paenibacillus dakarensis TaxID=1527293 RepID=UPI0006D536F6|nr:FAD:protein FMN transferase [Paenibacillus dakarensis]
MDVFKTKFSALLLLLSALLIIGGCANSSADSLEPSANNQKTEITEPIKKSYYIFDTIVQVKVYDSRITNRHFEEIDELLKRIDTEMSRTNDKSELYNVNANAGIKPVQVSEDTFKVIQKAYDYSKLTEGRFDLAIGPLVSLWNIGNEGAHVPDAGEITKLIPLSQYQQIELNPDNREVFLKEKGMILDLGGIAKGYAADEIAKYLTDNGFHSAIIDLGGNVLALGQKPGGRQWTIGIQDPDLTRGNPIGNLKVQNQTVVTSGIYERFFEENGKYYHHILDSETGYPVDNDLSSVTILTEKSIDADALSTSIFSMGLTRGLEFAEQLDHVEVLFITKDKKVYITSGMEDILTMTNDDYTLMK